VTDSGDEPPGNGTAVGRQEGNHLSVIPANGGMTWIDAATSSGDGLGTFSRRDRLIRRN